MTENRRSSDNLPCAQHVTIFIWAFGIVLTILSSTVYAVIDNRNRAVDEYRQISEGTNKMYLEIVQRLSRIEQKISK
jgi:hypothetical protein